MAPRDLDAIDATCVERLDSLGVLQLLRFSRRFDFDFDRIAFREDHRNLVSAIEDVADDRPKKKREYGVAAALARLGYAVDDNLKEVRALTSLAGSMAHR